MITMFGLILMSKREWESQVQSRVSRSLHDFIGAVLHSPNGIDFEFRDGMSESKMYEIVGKIVGKKRFRKRKKTEVKK